MTPQKIEGVEGIIALATGEGKTCLLHEAGTVSCWGAGQTSDDPESILKGITNAISIDIGDGHICVLRDDMTVLCWGYNTSGQLGNGEIYFGDSDVIEYFDELVQVAGITDAVGIATGGDHTCAVHEDGTVSCWGRKTGAAKSETEQQITTQTHSCESRISQMRPLSPLLLGILVPSTMTQPFHAGEQTRSDNWATDKSGKERTRRCP